MRRKVVNFQNRLGSNKTIVALAASFGTDDEDVSFGTDEDVRVLSRNPSKVHEYHPMQRVTDLCNLFLRVVDQQYGNL